MDRDVARHVVPRDHSTRIFEHTLDSTGIESHNHRVMNNGIPREHVATAIHANIVPATLHNVMPTEGVGVRERFERNGRTLAVFRPDVQPRTPARADAPTRENQPSNNGVAGSSIPAHARLAHVQPQQLPTVAPHPALPTTRVEAPVRAGQPLIVRGSDHSAATTPGAVGTPRPTSANPQNARRTVPLNSLVVIGQRQDSRFAATQRDNRTALSSHNGTSPLANRDMRHGVAFFFQAEDGIRDNSRHIIAK
jgi:hypothetical protein